MNKHMRRTTMNNPTPSPMSLAHAAMAAAVLALLVGCKSAPVKADPHAAVPDKIALGPVRMPAGVDYARARLIAENRRTKLYTELVGIGVPANEKLLFPARVAQDIGVTPVQMRRRFMDTVSRSRRFEIYDSTGTVTAEASDIVVDGQFTGTTQEIQTIEGGVRVAVTRVRLSLQMKDRYSGKLLFPAAVEVVGQTGRTTGDRVVLAPSDNLNNPEVQRRLGQDYERAMQRAFDDAARRVDAVLRPMGRVLAVDGNQIGMVGGSTHGLQGGDELVVFRATTAKLGESTVFATTRAVAVVRCDGVGTETSQCTLIRRDPAFQPQKDDYLVLSDFSATGVRQD
jgi:hypothetical protein